MYAHRLLKEKEDYFQTLSERGEKGAYFCRFIGFDDEYLAFYRQYQIATQKNGVYIQKPLPNPTGNQVQRFYETIGQNEFEMQRAFISFAARKWLAALNPTQQQYITQALLNQLETLQKQGAAMHILKNSFVKFMCWAHDCFEAPLSHIDEQHVPKILYEGDTNKYDVYMLHILAMAGCDVLYLNFTSDASYLQGDPSGTASQPILCKRRGVPARHFTQIDLKQREKANELQNKAEMNESWIVTNIWMQGSFFEEILKGNASRGLLDSSQNYNLYGRCFGIDDPNDYQYRLYKWKENLEQQNKPFVLVESHIEFPTPDEAKGIRPVRKENKDEILTELALQIHVPNRPHPTEWAQAGFINALKNEKETNMTRFYNACVRLVCWLNRYLPQLFPSDASAQNPVFLLYGSCTAAEAQFLNILSYMPIDVVFLSPDLSMQAVFADLGEGDRGRDEQLAMSQPDLPFPKELPKIKMATTAYHAERELDTMLYQGTGLFRNRQFLRSVPTTLKTTFDEIGILWHEESKYRPGFEERQGEVVVPNIFAKVAGIPNDDVNEYFRSIERMLTQKTIFVRAFPFLEKEEPREILQPHVREFIKDGELLPDIIKKHPSYAYAHLSEDVQDYILEKIQELIKLHWIQSDERYLDLICLGVLLKLNQTTLQLIQQFDFTKEIPKVVMIHSSETMMQLKEHIYLLFLNLVGFDIIVFTPTGYRDIEAGISPEAYEIYQVGSYQFDLRIPSMRVQRRNQGNGGFFQRLFGKG